MPTGSVWKNNIYFGWLVLCFGFAWKPLAFIPNSPHCSKSLSQRLASFCWGHISSGHEGLSDARKGKLNATVSVCLSLVFKCLPRFTALIIFRGDLFKTKVIYLGNHLPTLLEIFVGSYLIKVQHDQNTEIKRCYRYNNIIMAFVCKNQYSSVFFSFLNDSFSLNSFLGSVLWQRGRYSVCFGKCSYWWGSQLSRAGNVFLSPLLRLVSCSSLWGRLCPRGRV